MSSSHPLVFSPHNDVSLNGWLLYPAANLTSFLANEMVIAGLTMRTIIAAKAAPIVLSFAKDHLASEKTRFAVQQLLNFAMTDAAFAHREIDNGFNTVLTHHAVATWAAVESAIEQTLMNLIRNVPESRTLILRSAQNLKDERIRTTTEMDARRSLQSWERSISEQSAIARALTMMTVFELNLVLSDETKKHLTEMSEVRNVVIHRGGYIDGRFTEKCPWVSAAVGDLLNINELQMGQYFDAASRLAIELTKQTARSRYFKTA